MKTLRYLTLFILLASISLPQGTVMSASAQGKNLAPNPSFEKGKNGVLADWQSFSSGIEWTLSWANDIARSGKHSVCISSTIPNSNWASWETIDRIHFAGGRSYILSAYVKGDLTGSALIGEMQWDSNGVPVPTGDMIPVSFNNTNWTYNQLYFGKQTGAAVFQIMLGVNLMGGSSQSGTICFDDISVKENR
jgi:hypothetical protein